MSKLFNLSAPGLGIMVTCMFAAAATFVGTAGVPVASAQAAETGERASYILFAPDDQSVSMSGSTDDLRRARALRVGREALLYFRQGSTAYVVRDPATLREARSIFAPQEALGSEQSALGGRQAELGRRQAALGAEQARLGARQANAQPRYAADLASRQEALGRQQDALGEQQNVLGRQQNELGRKQDRLAHEADVRLRALLAEAIRRGVANRVQ